LVNTYHEQTCTSTSAGNYVCHESASTLLEKNGNGVAWVLILPTTIALLLLANTFSRFRRKRLVAWILVTVLVAYCLATGFSTGIVYLPATLFCVIAAVVDEPAKETTRG